MLTSQCDALLMFFLKQKTAYEIPKRDWSSDVCSSDLGRGPSCAESLKRQARKRSRVKLPTTKQGGSEMKYAVAISAALLLGASPVPPAFAQNPNDLVNQAVAAQGGADALRAFKTAVIKAEAKHWEPGQSMTAGGDARFLGDSTFTLTADG